MSVSQIYNGLELSASNNQGTGYVTGSNKTATKKIYLTMTEPTVNASGEIYSVAIMNDSGSADIILEQSTDVNPIGITATASAGIHGTLNYASNKLYSAAQLVGAEVNIQLFIGYDGTSASEEATITQNMITTFTNGFTISPTYMSRIVVTTVDNCTATVPDYGNIVLPKAGIYFSDIYYIDTYARVTSIIITDGSVSYMQEITSQLTTKGATTITPTTKAQTAVKKNIYTAGDITVAGDANLIATNIRKGVTIFGVAGSYDSGGVTP